VKAKTHYGIDIKETSQQNFTQKFGEQMKRQGGGDYASGVYFKESNGKPTIWINKDWLDMKSKTPGVLRDVMKDIRIQHEIGHHIYEDILSPGDKMKLQVPDGYKDSPKEWFSDAYSAWQRGKNESWMGNVPQIMENKFKTKSQLTDIWNKANKANNNK